MDEDRNRHRKVYAKGYFDGLEAGRTEMTPARFQSVFSGQSTVAKKIFEMVPIQEAWAPVQISSALTRVTKSTVDRRVLDGCLTALKDAGLIKEPRRGEFQRIEVREKEEAKVPKTEVATFVGTIASTPKSPIAILSTIAARLGAVNDEVKKIASDIETAALVIEEDMTENEENLGKLRQLQSILKSLA